MDVMAKLWLCGSLDLVEWLDRFWHDQPIIYDFKAEIQGTGNRSWYYKL